jgi:LytS/YehU family sensor histidine kinase
MQLHPHFIFNTLHGITTLMERDVETARRMLLHLADLLRAAISSQSQDLIQLRQELTFISSYVALERMRLGSRLEVNYNVDENANEALVPYMVLQPIVENAILHGAAACREGGWVNIACRVEQKSVVLEVENTAALKPAHKQDGLGLRNTRARLQNLFEQQASLDFSINDGIASTRIRLPMITAREAVAP